MTQSANPAASAPDPVADAAALRAATGRLLAEVEQLDDATAAKPSLLPGWTRGHVLAHLARNADALVNVFAARPMYASAESRDGDIERDAGRSVAEHLADLRESATRLDGAFAAQSDAAWERTVELRNGVTDRAYSLPFRRWIEVELHHVDLGIGYAMDDLPATFIERELANMARRFSGHPGIAAPIELRTEDGVSWRTGAAGDDSAKTVVVAGTPTALVAWLTGRSSGTGLSARDPLPELPAL
ncbi:mycothiol maleylpyruvate isomerase [Streptomyces abyssalis]|uniref:Mycothiol maleylpyruvate isomerase n=1 Tax=Streptomyces abyssalis TaxID=933944 RepID=A0A1E7JM43_9ACTN|nr:maleylpyruvate isomerase family mycothiol-dependent enzyme [Streptomyces abyssalis]OEU88714.1 mycothiol maleylpyruvate isomerase [Streptomyces abyssalis]OEU89448.1 mycothiol maleylpyruvate isomerase [Streptomyces abyssalis]OEV26669.1 mycothiol maleylpyruvate isomerase [Streptomyces nanshensis]